jgi:peptidoglycan/xylan/chitin deacetylase (PgdA/CDA1 family)
MAEYYQKILTQTLSPILNSCGISNLTKSAYSGKGQILILHRVVPASANKRIHNHLSLEICPEHLETIFNFFKKKNYDFIDLDTLPGWLEANRSTKKKFVIFTFDDGYKDNLQYAYPVFKRYNIPLTIYVTCAIPDRKAIIWWYILEDLILKYDRVKYSFSDGTIDMTCYSQRAKEKAFNRIRQLITSLNHENLEPELEKFFGKFGYDIHTERRDMGLTWNDVADMAQESLVTIGAHTLNHFNLRNLTEEQSFHEILESKNILQQKIKVPVKHFSYPFGEFKTRDVDLVKQSNFLTATTTENANIFTEHLNNLFTLPRISVNSLSTEAVLNLQVEGFFPAVVSKLKRMNRY